MSDLMKIGSDFGGGGTFKPFTSGISGAQRVTDAHGRFTDAAQAGRLFCGGSTILAINNATFTVATTGATATPIIGLWNPLNSGKNLSVLQASLSVVLTAVAATGPGGFVWMVSLGNSVISTGSTPFNRSTLSAAGSFAKFYAGTALTGMTGTLVTMCGSALNGGSAENVSFTATAVAMQTMSVPSVENVDGGILVPPGGVLALMATTTPVAHSVVPAIMWEELPIFVTT